MLKPRYGAALALVALAAVGCDDDCNPTTTPDTEMVRVSGICRSADDATPAVGVRVSLLGTNFADEVATGDDGAYSLLVPKGSRLYLHTDDFDTARGDVWFPLINVEPIDASDDITNWSIHACPITVCPELGTIAAYDNYLENGDVDDLYSVTSSAETSGVIAAAYFTIEDDEIVAFPPGLVATISSPDFVPGYVEFGRLFDEKTGIPDCSLGPEIMAPAGGTQTTDEGMWLAFGEPDFEGETVFLILTDTVLDVTWDVMEIPVRPGTLSLLLPGTIDGEPNQYFNDQCVAWGIECPIFGDIGRWSR